MPHHRLAPTAAAVLGSVLDLHLTGGHLVGAVAPEFCDAASVYLLERWLAEDAAPPTPDAPAIEARRLAVRVGADASEDWGGIFPIDEVVVFPRDTPYARALADGRPQLLGGVDPHTADRLTRSGRGDTRIDGLLRTASFLVVPLLLRGTAVGFLVCTRGPGARSFDRVDIAAAETLAARAAISLDNARLYERERRTALAIRNSLLPAAATSAPGCRVAHAYQPAGSAGVVGGDWFDVMIRPSGRVGLIVGDAMGHGPEAAVAMIQLRTAVRTLAALDTAPQELLRHLDALAADTPGASFATCLYAEWDPAAGLCTLIGAGHPPPLVRVGGGRTSVVSLSAGLPLGLGSWAAEPTVLPIREPTLLLLYTDGLVESRHEDIDIGILRLAHHLNAARGTPQAICDTLLRLTADRAPADDRTLLLAELSPPT
ncbi:PP2C family protein-serine/threonine phosphatase [Peterkaempfera bronchialis]|uniref:PP2C family protein-serine/threonine phosphatase n=1 Tax=Peterkaempfera bronchialis TaxID=2126346 RepID=UPI001E65DAB8|nr:SpoIIE family protein phosphatase [Peterkaempfera bronchialis]